MVFKKCISFPFPKIPADDQKEKKKKDFKTLCNVKLQDRMMFYPEKPPPDMQ